VSDLGKKLRFRSPAKSFQVIYDGCRELQKPRSDLNLTTLIRLQTELESLEATGHFPRSGEPQNLTPKIRLLCRYVQDFYRASTEGHEYPVWSKAHALAMRDLLVFLTRYVRRYNDLNGHLPLMGPYYEGPQHLWDNSPWKEAPYKNQTSPNARTTL
jgi:hypothetical protein